MYISEIDKGSKMESKKKRAFILLDPDILTKRTNQQTGGQTDTQIGRRRKKKSGRSHGHYLNVVLHARTHANVLVYLCFLTPSPSCLLYQLSSMFNNASLSPAIFYRLLLLLFTTYTEEHA